MNPRARARILLLLVALVCGGAVWGVIWYRSRPLSLKELYQRLPQHDAVVLYVDLRALQHADLFQILSDSKVAQEPEYRLFVQKTEFDYIQDLDSALVAFTPSGKYMLATGRFEWKTLRQYAQSEGGQCAVAICRMQGSMPDRRISFSPLQKNVMAMAVSTEPEAVYRLMTPRSNVDPDLPSAPIWLYIPGSVLSSGERLPSGTQMFAHTLEKASRVILSFTPEGDGLAARLEVVCPDSRDAASIAGDLTRATSLLRQMIEREHHQPNAGDLSGVLTAGSFRSEGAKVLGQWPIGRRFVANVLSGGVN